MQGGCNCLLRDARALVAPSGLDTIIESMPAKRRPHYCRQPLRLSAAEDTDSNHALFKTETKTAASATGPDAGGDRNAPDRGGRGRAPSDTAPTATTLPPVPAKRLECLQLAIADLRQTFGDRYARGAEYAAAPGRPGTAGRRYGAERHLPADFSAEFWQLQRAALLANPLLDFPELLVVKRRPIPPTQPVNRRRGNDGQPLWISAGPGAEIGLPSNHECNSSLCRQGYDNELASCCPRTPQAALRTLFRPEDGGYVGEVDLHWDADRLLFTRSDAQNWKVCEMRLDGSGLRQVTQLPADVDCYDACYLPDGRIVFGSSAPVQAVPCWHGLRAVTNLYLANADGTAPRRLCFDQDHDLHPVVASNGQVLFNRWDYTGISHIFLRQLMVMNPDGTGQRAIYGSNSWYPNSLYFPRPLPGDPQRLVCVLSGYHGVHKMGQLVVLDVGQGWHEATGIVQRISGRGDRFHR